MPCPLFRCCRSKSTEKNERGARNISSFVPTLCTRRTKPGSNQRECSTSTPRCNLSDDKAKAVQYATVKSRLPFFVTRALSAQVLPRRPRISPRWDETRQRDDAAELEHLFTGGARWCLPLRHERSQGGRSTSRLVEIRLEGFAEIRRRAEAADAA